MNALTASSTPALEACSRGAGFEDSPRLEVKRHARAAVTLQADLVAAFIGPLETP